MLYTLECRTDQINLEKKRGFPHECGIKVFPKYSEMGLVPILPVFINVLNHDVPHFNKKNIFFT